VRRVASRPPFECIALLLQGGGALGAYQAGVYEALAEADLLPDWIAGISIGAINAALIAGNPPADRVARLRNFWEAITAHPMQAWVDQAGGDQTWIDAIETPFGTGDAARGFYNQWAAGNTILQGAPGFFLPRVPPAFLAPPGTRDATSYYDTSELKTTLERLVDFDRINGNPTRLSIGAVNVATGNFVYFDSTTDKIRADHVMASGALPPGFPAVEIDGQYYWDGGLVSNTPLDWVVASEPVQDTLAFQVDLWSARGRPPSDLTEVAVRQKEIQFSSRTRASTDQFKRLQHMRAAAADLLHKLPGDIAKSPEATALAALADRKVYNIIQLIYRSKSYEGNSKDYEFSRRSMEDHWRAGYHDAARTLRHRAVLERPDNDEGVFTFDIGDNDPPKQSAFHARSNT
jgi:NTE family protein